MLHTIENGKYIATINELGAELTTLTCKNDGYEVIWCGDPAIWSGRSPLLFPFVGKLVNGGYTYEGKKYEMSKHGFARGTTFTVTEKTATAITFTFADWEKNYAAYPFKYVLSATYELKDDGLRFTYKVENLDDKVMYCSLGAHPAINAVDAKLVFPCAEDQDAWQYGPDGLYKDEHTPFLHNETVYQTDAHTFDNDSYTLRDLNSSYVDVHSSATSRVVRVTFGGCPFVGIWAKPAAPYVCIEPWFGCDDHTRHNGNLTEKVGIQKLEAGETLTLSVDILPEV